MVLKLLIAAAALSLLAYGVSADTKLNSPITVGPGLGVAGSTISIYEPQRCDGFSAGDGAITDGTTDFVSATASFVAADVGKAITVAGAGANQHADVPTLVAAGTGYAVNDLLTLVGGSGTAAVIRVKAVSGGVITDFGYQSLGEYSVVPTGTIATTGAGSNDATFTSTWLRDALATTIATVVGPTEVDLATPASATVSGALWTYGSDYAVQINANDIANMPSGVCPIASPIIIAAGRRLAGTTRGKTTLTWIGASRDGPMITTDEPTSTVSRAKLENFNVDGRGSADVCLQLHSFSEGTISDVIAQNCVEAIASFDASLNDTGQGFIQNKIFGLTLASGTATTASAMPLRTGIVGNMGYTRAVDLKILYKNRTGFECGYADNNSFYGIWLFRNSGGVAPVSLDLRGDTVSESGHQASCQFNVIYSLTNGGSPAGSTGVITARGGLVTPSRQNSIYGLNLDPGSPLPVLEDNGARLLCHRMNGNDNTCTAWAFNSVNCGNPAGTTTSANFVAAGCGVTGSPSIFVPQYTGKMRLTISGNMTNDTATKGVYVAAFWGPGTPPAAGDNIEIVPDVLACGRVAILEDTPSGSFIVPFTVDCVISGAVAGDTYWYDAGFHRTGAAGTATISGVRLGATEMN